MCSLVVRQLIASISEIKGDLYRLFEGFVDVSVLPLLCSGLEHSHQGVCLLSCLELLGCDCIFWSDSTEVLFCCDQNNGDLLLDFTNLGLPLGDVV